MSRNSILHWPFDILYFLVYLFHLHYQIILAFHFTMTNENKTNKGNLCTGKCSFVKLPEDLPLCSFIFSCFNYCISYLSSSNSFVPIDCSYFFLWLFRAVRFALLAEILDAHGWMIIKCHFGSFLYHYIFYLRSIVHLYLRWLSKDDRLNGIKYNGLAICLLRY